MPRKKENRVVLNLGAEQHTFFKKYCAAKFSTMTQEIKQMILALQRREEARKLRELERQARIADLEQQIAAVKIEGNPEK